MAENIGGKDDRFQTAASEAKAIENEDVASQIKQIKFDLQELKSVGFETNREVKSYFRTTEKNHQVYRQEMSEMRSDVQALTRRSASQEKACRMSCGVSKRKTKDKIPQRQQTMLGRRGWIRVTKAGSVGSMVALVLGTIWHRQDQVARLKDKVVESEKQVIYGERHQKIVSDNAELKEQQKVIQEQQQRPWWWNWRSQQPINHADKICESKKRVTTAMEHESKDSDWSEFGRTFEEGGVSA